MVRRDVASLDRRFYPGVGNNWDDEYFRQLVLEYADPTSVLLDLGAGAGIVSQMDFRGSVAVVHGVDPDPRVEENPYLHVPVVGMAEDLPYRASTFDLVVADNVLEHLAAPEVAFREVRRVLRPGGVFLFKTPNRKHYMPMVSRATPHRFHQWVSSRRGRAEVDTFPTVYLANSGEQLRRLANASGMVLERLDHVESRPEYLRFNALTYLPGIAYERTVNRFERLRGFRVLLAGVLRRT